MAKWKSLWVNKHPQVVTVKDWSVFDVDDGNRHVVGFVAEHDSRRVSMPIDILYGQTLEAVAQRGYRYVLTGDPGPGEREDAAGTWVRHAMVQNTGDYTDVTDEIWRKHIDGRASAPTGDPDACR